MDKFTKEQISLFTVVAAVLMLLAFFFFNLIPGGWHTITPWKLLTEGRPGFLGYVFLILFLLTPIYLCLYAYRDVKALEPLKPIFKIPAKVVYLLPLILLCVLIVYFLIDQGMAAVWVYLLGAAAVFYLGMKDE